MRWGAMIALAMMSACSFDPQNPLATGVVLVARDAGPTGGDAEALIDEAGTATTTADAGADAGPTPGADAEPAVDVDPGADGGPPVDAGPAPDSGPAPDAGPAPDSGPATTPDAGPISDTGPADSGVAFPYVPTNLAPADVAGARTAVAVLEVPTGETCTVDSSGPEFDGSCGMVNDANLAVVTMPGGGEAALVTLARLRVAPNGIIRDTTLRLVGSRPIIFLVSGNVDIEGGLDASARGGNAGPGAGTTAQCGMAIGGNGDDNDDAGGGGGGGARGTQGGLGGNGANSTLSPGGMRGASFDDPTLAPLFGGCRGGRGGDVPSGELNGGDGGDGGGGGGGLQISAGAQLRVTGRIHAGGGAGEGGEARAGGGGGGGSGGAILLEATTLILTSSGRITLNGGGGGEGASGARPNEGGIDGQSGDDAPVSVRSVARGGGNTTASGGDGGDGANVGDAAESGGTGSGPSGAVLRGGGGGGGGGGLGRLRLRASSCTVDSELSAVLRRDCP